MTAKVEFGSAAWADAAGRILAEVVDEYGAALAGQSLAAREVYLNAPGHLGGPRLAFIFGVADGTATFTGDDGRPVDMTVEMDYAAARAGAPTILGKTAEDIEARRLRREAAVAAGAIRVEGSVDGAPLVLRQALAEWHNRLAKLVS